MASRLLSASEDLTDSEVGLWNEIGGNTFFAYFALHYIRVVCRDVEYQGILYQLVVEALDSQS